MLILAIATEIEDKLKSKTATVKTEGDRQLVNGALTATQHSSWHFKNILLHVSSNHLARLLLRQMKLRTRRRSSERHSRQKCGCHEIPHRATRKRSLTSRQWADRKSPMRMIRVSTPVLRWLRLIETGVGDAARSCCCCCCCWWRSFRLISDFPSPSSPPPSSSPSASLWAPDLSFRCRNTSRPMHRTSAMMIMSIEDLARNRRRKRLILAPSTHKYRQLTCWNGRHQTVYHWTSTTTTDTWLFLSPSPSPSLIYTRRSASWRIRHAPDIRSDYTCRLCQGASVAGIACSFSYDRLRGPLQHKSLTARFTVHGPSCRRLQ